MDFLDRWVNIDLYHTNFVLKGPTQNKVPEIRLTDLGTILAIIKIDADQSPLRILKSPRSMCQIYGNMCLSKILQNNEAMKLRTY